VNQVSRRHGILRVLFKTYFSLLNAYREGLLWHYDSDDVSSLSLRDAFVYRIVIFVFLFVFMLVLYCFCVATEFSVNKDLYIIPLLTLSAYNTEWGLCNGRRPSVCLSHSAAARRCCKFAAVGPAAMKCRSIAAAAACECGQCHVVSVRSSWTQTCSGSINRHSSSWEHFIYRSIVVIHHIMHEYYYIYIFIRINCSFKPRN